MRPNPNSNTKVKHSHKNPTCKARAALTAASQPLNASATAMMQMQSTIPLSNNAAGAPSVGTSTASRKPPFATAHSRISSQTENAFNAAL